MGEVEVAAWLKALPLAPEFHPTEAEFGDLIAYILKIEEEARQYGVCKIVPPYTKASKKTVATNLNRSLSMSRETVPSTVHGSCTTSMSRSMGGVIAGPQLGKPKGSFLDVSGADSLGKAKFATRRQQLGWNPKRARGVSHSQTHKLVWQSGESYTLEQFEVKAKLFSRQRLGTCRDVSPLSVETLFWRAAGEKPISVEYANDIPGSAFGEPLYSSLSARGKKRKKGPEDYDQCCSMGSRGEEYFQDDEYSTVTDDFEVNEGMRSKNSGTEAGGDNGGGAGWKLASSAWNMRNVARSQGSLLRFMPEEVPGVTSPMVYIGMLFSWFAWHVEDHELHSLNYLHMGASKTWYAVPGDAAPALEEAVRVHGYGGQLNSRAAFSLLGEKTTVMSPEVLVAAGVPCCRLVQNAGEYVVTFPRAYHLGFSHGFNCGEAANFATPGWLDVAKDAAARRAAMNYLPMLSHQQLLYLLTMSLPARMPASSPSEPRSSRLKVRKKSLGEEMVKTIFVNDVIHNNRLLGILLDKGVSCCLLVTDASNRGSSIMPSLEDSEIRSVAWSSEVVDNPLQPVVSRLSQLGAEPSGIQATSQRMNLVTRSDDVIAGAQLCLSGIAVSAADTMMPKDISSAEVTNNESYSGVDHPCSDSTGPATERSSFELTATAKCSKKSLVTQSLAIDWGTLPCAACGILCYATMAVVEPTLAAASTFKPMPIRLGRGAVNRASETGDSAMKQADLGSHSCQNVYQAPGLNQDKMLELCPPLGGGGKSEQSAQNGISARPQEVKDVGDGTKFGLASDLEMINGRGCTVLHDAFDKENGEAVEPALGRSEILATIMDASVRQEEVHVVKIAKKLSVMGDELVSQLAVGDTKLTNGSSNTSSLHVEVGAPASAKSEVDNDNQGVDVVKLGVDGLMLGQLVKTEVTNLVNRNDMNHAPQVTEKGVSPEEQNKPGNSIGASRQTQNSQVVPCIREQIDSCPSDRLKDCSGEAQTVCKNVESGATLAEIPTSQLSKEVEKRSVTALSSLQLLACVYEDSSDLDDEIVSEDESCEVHGRPDSGVGHPFMDISGLSADGSWLCLTPAESRAAFPLSATFPSYTFQSLVEGPDALAKVFISGGFIFVETSRPGSPASGNGTLTNEEAGERGSEGKEKIIIDVLSASSQFSAENGSNISIDEKVDDMQELYRRINHQALTVDTQDDELLIEFEDKSRTVSWCPEPSRFDEVLLSETGHRHDIEASKICLEPVSVTANSMVTHLGKNPKNFGVCYPEREYGGGEVGKHLCSTSSTLSNVLALGGELSPLPEPVQNCYPNAGVVPLKLSDSALFGADESISRVQRISKAVDPGRSGMISLCNPIEVNNRFVGDSQTVRPVTNAAESSLGTQFDRAHSQMQNQVKGIDLPHFVAPKLGALRADRGAARPRVLCLEHAVEAQERLQAIGGGHILIVCHSDFVDYELRAKDLAQELEIEHNWRDIPFTKGSEDESIVVKAAVDVEEDDDQGLIDWVTQLGLLVHPRYRSRESETSDGLRKGTGAFRTGPFKRGKPGRPLGNRLMAGRLGLTRKGGDDPKSYPSSTTVMELGMQTKETKKKRCMVAGRWCGKVWRVNQVHPLLGGCRIVDPSLQLGPSSTSSYALSLMADSETYKSRRMLSSNRLEPSFDGQFFPVTSAEDHQSPAIKKRGKQRKMTDLETDSASEDVTGGQLRMTNLASMYTEKTFSAVTGCMELSQCSVDLVGKMVGRNGPEHDENLENRRGILTMDVNGDEPTTYPNHTNPVGAIQTLKTDISAEALGQTVLSIPSVPNDALTANDKIRCLNQVYQAPIQRSGGLESAGADENLAIVLSMGGNDCALLTGSVQMPALMSHCLQEQSDIQHGAEMIDSGLGNDSPLLLMGHPTEPRSANSDVGGSRATLNEMNGSSGPSIPTVYSSSQTSHRNLVGRAFTGNKVSIIGKERAVWRDVPIACTPSFPAVSPFPGGCSEQTVHNNHDGSHMYIPFSSSDTREPGSEATVVVEGLCEEKSSSKNFVQGESKVLPLQNIQEQTAEKMLDIKAVRAMAVPGFPIGPSKGSLGEAIENIESDERVSNLATPTLVGLKRKTDGHIGEFPCKKIRPVESGKNVLNMENPGRSVLIDQVSHNEIVNDHCEGPCGTAGFPQNEHEELDCEIGSSPQTLREIKHLYGVPDCRRQFISEDRRMASASGNHLQACHLEEQGSSDVLNLKEGYGHEHSLCEKEQGSSLTPLNSTALCLSASYQQSFAAGNSDLVGTDELGKGVREQPLGHVVPSLTPSRERPVSRTRGKRTKHVGWTNLKHSKPGISRMDKSLLKCEVKCDVQENSSDNQNLQPGQCVEARFEAEDSDLGLETGDQSQNRTCPSTRLRARGPTAEETESETEAEEFKVTSQRSKKKGRPKKKKVMGRKPKEEEDGEFQCDLDGCRMSFGTEAELQIHKENRCTFKGCGKPFSMHKYLLQHRRVHLDERPLKCSWPGCEQAFKWPWARTEHMRVHTGERPYSCPDCDQTFRFVSDFSRHKRITGHTKG